MEYVNKYPRKRNYDYSWEGKYFVTICTKDRINWFGEINDGKLVLNEFGEFAKSTWANIPNYYENILIDEFKILPNHIHGIIEILPDFSQDESFKLNIYPSDRIHSGHSVRVEQCSTPSYDFQNYGQLSKIIHSFKDIVTKSAHKNFNNYKFKWQRSFHDSIIRNEKQLKNVRRYIYYNELHH